MRYLHLFFFNYKKLTFESLILWKVRSFIVSSEQYIWIWIHCCTALLLTAPTGPFPIPSDITQPGQGSWLWSKHLALKLIFALFNGQYVCVVCQPGIGLATWLQRLMAGRRRRLSLNEIYTCREAGQLSSSVVDTALNFTPATSTTSTLGLPPLFQLHPLMLNRPPPSEA